MLRFAASVFALLVVSVCRADENPPLLLHHPTVNATQVVFVYAGDLWSVPQEGGPAQRLTAGNGSASRPVFSPDGKRDRLHRELRRKRGRLCDSSQRRYAAEAYVSSGGR